MFIKCFLLFFILGQIDTTSTRARFTPRRRVPLPESDLTAQKSCQLPNFPQGRFRFKQKSHLIKFICLPGFDLVGNRYATCRDGEWDEPVPVCVKPGCALDTIENGIQWNLRRGAWVVSFCLPGYKLVGSSVIYCDGRKWNDTAPKCVDGASSASASQLSCDFEDANLCGWTHDDLHDFDWKRLNRKTPSSFLFTGPSYDHTYGEGESGYYMYIESTSRLENDMARLISPIYDATLAKNGCFSFFYHMFGKTTGGLLVYQKPDNLPLQSLLQLPLAEKQKYIMFEKWGNQGDFWYRNVANLTDLSDNFQIVIEGVRGSSFTSDIAIDDVSILQGDNCTAANKTAATPAVIVPDSCIGRCDVYGDANKKAQNTTSAAVCDCTLACLMNSDCCPDFFDLCMFGSTTADDTTTPAELPQTQKLVASTIPTTSSTTKSTTTSTTTAKTTVRTTKPTTKPTTPPTTPPTTTMKTTTKFISTTIRKVPTIIFKTTTPIYNATGKIPKDNSSKPAIVKPTTTTEKVVIKVVTTARTTTEPFTTSRINDKVKQQNVEANGYKATEIKSESHALRTSLLLVAALLCACGAAWGAWRARGVWRARGAWGARGTAGLARLRGRVRRDPDVQYLRDDTDQ